MAFINHIKFSDFADTKANVLFSVLISKLDNPSNDYLTMPTVIFTFLNLTSVVLAIVAPRPNVSRGEFTKEDVKNKKG